MNAETLEQANALTERITETQRVLTAWETAERLGNSAIYLKCKNNSEQWMKVSSETFLIVKSLNVAHFQQQLTSLQAELAKL